MRRKTIKRKEKSVVLSENKTKEKTKRMERLALESTFSIAFERGITERKI